MKARTHDYRVSVTWEGSRGVGTESYQSYDRRYRVRVDGKPDLSGSADAAFRGEPGLHNPEDLLVAAVSSCHMLFYLSLCARSGIRVVQYEDEARGTLKLEPDGGGAFEEVVLRPHVRIHRADDLESAVALHERAGELCFIANSCRFSIRHEPRVELA